MKTTLSAKDSLKWYAAMDVEHVLSTDPNRWVVTPKPAPQIRQAQQIPTLLVDNNSTSRALADAATNLEQLQSSLLAFNGCDLKKTATHTVFADGNSTAKIMLIGEAPGSSEDETGIPFCGDSGKLLDNLLATINLSREANIYISNAVFWRPPANRRPTKEEVEICRPFVEKHIALIRPDLLILVGATAVTSLLGDFEITKIRQEYHQYQNQYLTKPITTTAIFHPAYLMRQPFQKKAMWFDLLKIQEFLHFG